MARNDSIDTDRQTYSGFEPRRQPVQARSKERVDRILDAAVELLKEEGYNAVKTNHIAKRAGISIGSVYQFFPNRFAIFHALAQRYQIRIAEILQEEMGPEAPNRPWEETVNRVIDILAEMWQSDRSFHTVWMAIKNTAELEDADAYYRNHEIYEILENFLRDILPDHEAAQLRTIASVIVETTNLFLDNSMREKASQGPQIVDELKFLLVSYLRAHAQMAHVRYN